MRMKEQLWELIKKRPGVSAIQVSSQLDWPLRRVKALLTRLEGENKVALRIYPVDIVELGDALVHIEGGIRGLKVLRERLMERERKLFEETVKAKGSGDEARAKVYARECANVRRLIALVDHNEVRMDEFSQRVKGMLTYTAAL